MGFSSLQLSCYLLLCSLRRALRKVARSKFFPCMEKPSIRTTRSWYHCVMPKKPDTFVCGKFPKGQVRVLRPKFLALGNAGIGSQFCCANILVSATPTATVDRCGWHANLFRMKLDSNISRLPRLWKFHMKVDFEDFLSIPSQCVHPR